MIIRKTLMSVSIAALLASGCMATGGMTQADLAYMNSDVPGQYQSGFSSAADKGDANREGVKNYSKRYAAICAVIGAGAGGFIGNKVAKDGNKTEGTAIGILLGAAAGAVTCNTIGKRQEKFAYSEASNDESIKAANLTLKEAQNTSASAERLVDNHKTKLAALRKEVAKDDMAREALNKQIGAATYDQRLLEKTSSEFSADIKLMEAAMNKPNGAHLKEKRLALIAEKKRIDQKSEELKLEIENATQV